MRRGIRPFSDSSGGELQAPLAHEDTMDEPINYTRCSTRYGKRNTSAPTRGTTEPEVDNGPVAVRADTIEIFSLNPARSLKVWPLAFPLSRGQGVCWRC